MYNHKLHPKCRIIAAGNLATDRAIVTPMSTALTTRMTNYRMMVDHQAWVDWANSNEIDHRVISFIKFKPISLHNVKHDVQEMSFPVPRTWAMVSKIIQKVGKIEQDTKTRIAGTVGEGAAVEFSTFTNIYQSLPTIEQILAGQWKVPTEPSTQYAITTMLAHNINIDNIAKIITAIERLPPEFQVMTFKDIHKKCPELKGHDLIKQWVIRNASCLL